MRDITRKIEVLVIHVRQIEEENKQLNSLRDWLLEEIEAAEHPKDLSPDFVEKLREKLNA